MARVAGRAGASEKLDQGDDQPALGDQRRNHPFEEVGFGPLDIGPERPDIRLGREIGIEQGEMLFSQGLGLSLGKAALRQALDEPVGVEGDSYTQALTIGTVPPGGNDPGDRPAPD